MSGGCCLLDVNGVGYEVQVPLPALEELARAEGQVRLYTYLHLREDAVQLFGFLTPGGEKGLRAPDRGHRRRPEDRLCPSCPYLPVERLRKPWRGTTTASWPRSPGSGKRPRKGWPWNFAASWRRAEPGQVRHGRERRERGGGCRRGAGGLGLSDANAALQAVEAAAAGEDEEPNRPGPRPRGP